MHLASRWLAQSSRNGHWFGAHSANCFIKRNTSQMLLLLLLLPLLSCIICIFSGLSPRQHTSHTTAHIVQQSTIYYGQSYTCSNSSSLTAEAATDHRLFDYEYSYDKLLRLHVFARLRSSVLGGKWGLRCCSSDRSVEGLLRAPDAGS